MKKRLIPRATFMIFLMIFMSFHISLVMAQGSQTPQAIKDYNELPDYVQSFFGNNQDAFQAADVTFNTRDNTLSFSQGVQIQLGLPGQETRESDESYAARTNKEKLQFTQEKDGRVFIRSNEGTIHLKIEAEGGLRLPPVQLDFKGDLAKITTADDHHISRGKNNLNEHIYEEAEIYMSKDLKQIAGIKLGGDSEYKFTSKKGEGLPPFTLQSANGENVYLSKRGEPGSESFERMFGRPTAREGTVTLIPNKDKGFDLRGAGDLDLAFPLMEIEIGTTLRQQGRPTTDVKTRGYVIFQGKSGSFHIPNLKTFHEFLYGDDTLQKGHVPESREHTINVKGYTGTVGYGNPDKPRVYKEFTFNQGIIHKFGRKTLDTYHNRGVLGFNDQEGFRGGDLHLEGGKAAVRTGPSITEVLPDEGPGRVVVKPPQVYDDQQVPPLPPTGPSTGQGSPQETTTQPTPATTRPAPTQPIALPLNTATAQAFAEKQGECEELQNRKRILEQQLMQLRNANLRGRSTRSVQLQRDSLQAQITTLNKQITTCQQELQRMQSQALPSTTGGLSTAAWLGIAGGAAALIAALILFTGDDDKDKDNYESSSGYESTNLGDER